MKKSHENVLLSLIVIVFAGIFVYFNNLGGLRDIFSSAATQEQILSMPFYDVDQNELNLKKMEGKPTVVNFWATWCPVCTEKMEGLNTFAGAFEAQGGQVLAISNDQGTPAKIRAYYKQRGYENLAVYIDPRGALLSSMGGRGLPTAALLSADGEILGLIEGGFDWTSAEAVELIKKRFDIDLDSL